MSFPKITISDFSKHNGDEFFRIKLGCELVLEEHIHSS
jgi:hypothetical protein